MEQNVPTEGQSSGQVPNTEITPEFKKPVLTGRIGKLRKKVKYSEEPLNLNDVPEESTTIHPPAMMVANNFPIPYKEPNWSGVCPDVNNQKYYVEVVKSGMIVETIDLMQKPYFVFGRLTNCDIMMAHPSISRHHAVLQYKAFSEEGEQPCGWYVFDLGSTHGTFINKKQLKPNRYTRIKVGHHLVFGISTRTYVFMGPAEDAEEESELTVSEIKQKAEEIKKEKQKLIQEAIEQKNKEKVEPEKKEKDEGIDWGMGDDAEEEPDLADNPFASTANEELYLTDPKKTLRGYFEREGHELTYDCEERGVGQFLCRVELPVDDTRGRPIVAEVLHKGKKKEAVIQCALEACRMLDRAGLLRQAKHESRRRKLRDYSADDYYSSDEDSFLDRTGTVEKKREMRRRKHNIQPDEQDDKKPVTYHQLLKQIEETEKKIQVEERSLQRLRDAGKLKTETSTEEGDSLDNFMSSLTNQGLSMAQKAEISNTKMAIKKLRLELSETMRLADIARPADLPPLIKKTETTMSLKKGDNSVVYGKRMKLKEPARLRDKKPRIETVTRLDEDFVEEVDSDEEEIMVSKNGENNKNINDNKKEENPIIESENNNISAGSEKDNEGVSSTNKDDSSKIPKKYYGPVRPPDGYVVPDGYYDQLSDRDLPEITENKEVGESPHY